MKLFAFEPASLHGILYLSDAFIQCLLLSVSGKYLAKDL